MNFKTALVLCALVATCMFPRTASAGLIVTFQESGSDVVATLSGSFASLPSPSSTTSFGSPFGNRIQPSVPYFAADQTSGGVDADGYNFAANFLPFGTSGALFDATSTAGLNTRLSINRSTLYLVTSYTPGTSFTGTLTWAGKDFETLFLTEGSYVGTLSNAETVTINVGAAPIPEPGTWAAAALLAGGAAFMRWRQRRSA